MILYAYKKLSKSDQSVASGRYPAIPLTTTNRTAPAGGHTRSDRYGESGTSWTMIMKPAAKIV